MNIAEANGTCFNKLSVRFLFSSFSSIDCRGEHTLIDIKAIEGTYERVTHITNLGIIIVSVNKATWLIINLYVVKQLGNARVIFLCFTQNCIPELSIADVKLNSQLNNTGQIVTTILNEH